MTLQKSLLALLLLVIASSVSSTTCGTNPLLDIYGIAASFADSEIVSGLKYCKSLQNKETCCDAATINGFQARVDELIERLSTAVGERDKNMINFRNDVLPTLADKSRSFEDASEKAGEKIRATMQSGGSGDLTLDTLNSVVFAMASAYSSIATSLIGDISWLREAFDDYQKDRATCVIDIVKIQAAAWCLACDPEYTTKGVSADGITFSQDLVRDLSVPCDPYFVGSLSQSMLLSINLMNEFMAEFTTSLNKITAGDANGATEFMAALTKMKTSQASMGTDFMPIEFPATCYPGECDWIATDMFKGGILDEVLLILGGAEQDIDETGKRRLKEKGTNNRMLSGSWDPDTDEAGVTVTFSNNPGDVDNGGDDDSDDKSAMLFKSIIGGLVVLFTVLMI